MKTFKQYVNECCGFQTAICTREDLSYDELLEERTADEIRDAVEHGKTWCVVCDEPMSHKYDACKKHTPVWNELLGFVKDHTFEEAMEKFPQLGSYAIMLAANRVGRQDVANKALDSK